MQHKSLSMKILAGLITVLAGSSQALAAADSTASNTGIWKRSLTGNLNFSQTYYDNWAKGGTDALTWDLNFGGSANIDVEAYSWENTFRTTYGKTKIQALPSRKSADEWKVESIYTRKYGAWVKPFVSGRANSQWTDGYSYNDSARTRTLISTFFDPAYFIETAGLGFGYENYLTERLGLTLKQTVSDKYGYADDPKTKTNIEAIKSEYGLGSVTEFKKEVLENILVSSRLELFANFKGFDEIDANWESVLTAKVNKWVNVNFNLNLLYDKDLSEDVQTKEGLSVGISFLSL